MNAAGSGTVAVFAVALQFGFIPLADASPGTITSSLTADEVIDLTNYPPPADPQPVSGSGLLGVGSRTVAPETGSCSKEVSDPEDSMTEWGLMVCKSTAPGTAAVTGIVLSPTNEPVRDALVEVAPSAGGFVLPTRTDADGAFAFVDLPIDGSARRYDLTVLAAATSGLGVYRVVNDLYLANTTYQTVVELEPEPQVYDEASPAADGEQSPAQLGTGPYPSHSRVPPSIKVALFEKDPDCRRETDTARDVRNYPWKFYVLHVATAEIYADWPQKAVRANAAVIQNYAWSWRLRGLQQYGSNRVLAHIENTTNRQCFKPHKKVPTAWSSQVNDVLDERVVNGNGDIFETQYRGGDPSGKCKESLYPQDGDKLSQFGSNARAEGNSADCGGAEIWRDIVEYYYNPTVQPGLAPAGADTGYSKEPGKVRFSFSSTGSWEFEVQVELDAGEGPVWSRIHKRGWSTKLREIINAFTYDPPSDRQGSCHPYRVRATNPVGSSSWVLFAGGQSICPG